MIGLTAHVADFEPDTAPTQRSDVQAVVTLYGISNLLNIGEGFSEAVKNVHRSPAVTEALWYMVWHLTNFLVHPLCKIKTRHFMQAQ